MTVRPTQGSNRFPTLTDKPDTTRRDGNEKTWSKNTLYQNTGEKQKDPVRVVLLLEKSMRRPESNTFAARAAFTWRRTCNTAGRLSTRTKVCPPLIVSAVVLWINKDERRLELCTLAPGSSGKVYFDLRKRGLLDLSAVRTKGSAMHACILQESARFAKYSLEYWKQSARPNYRIRLRTVFQPLCCE